jgi:hypothetical protein
MDSPFSSSSISSSDRVPQRFKLRIQLERRPPGPAGFQETESKYCEGEGDDLLYPRARPTVDRGLRRNEPRLLGPGVFY